MYVYIYVCEIYTTRFYRHAITRGTEHVCVGHTWDREVHPSFSLAWATNTRDWCDAWRYGRGTRKGYNRFKRSRQAWLRIVDPLSGAADGATRGLTVFRRNSQALRYLVCFIIRCFQPRHWGSWKHGNKVWFKNFITAFALRRIWGNHWIYYVQRRRFIVSSWFVCILFQSSTDFIK